jgi:hypothetical protein
MSKNTKPTIEGTVGLHDILHDPRTGMWIWFFDDRKNFKEVTEDEMFVLVDLFTSHGLNPFEVQYVLTDGGFETVWCKGK